MIQVIYDVRAYRRILKDTVREGDVVIELGPHTGRSTLSYAGKAKLSVAVDKAEQAKRAFGKLMKAHANLVFLKEDARGFDAIKKVLKHTKSCDVLAVDLGGGRYADTVFKVWATWSGVFQPRDSVIRSRALAEFIQRAEIKDDSVKKKFPDAGWLATWGRATPYKLRKQLEEFRYWIDINKPLD
jgi:hypothetical protein